jgi:hypothetical protein
VHQQNSLLDLGPCQNIGVLSLLVPPIHEVNHAPTEVGGL